MLTWWRTRRPRDRLLAGIAALIGLLALSTVLSVNVFPVVTNDSVTYIAHSRDLSEYGWVTFGYRQIGYPILIGGIRELADILTIEPMLFVSVVQRTLLLIAGGLAAVAFRWWSLPLIVLLLAADTLAFSNLMLTEGVSLSLSVLLAIALGFLLGRKGESPELRPEVFWFLSSSVVILSALLVLIRFPFAVFGAAPLAVAIFHWRTRLRLAAIALFGVYLVFLGVLTVFLSLENQEEFGALFPSVNSARAEYWAAWTLVFSVDGADPDDPELIDFYDDGTPYEFIQEVDGSGLSYEDRKSLFEDEVRSLFSAADVSPVGSQLEAAIWALAGGRTDDIRGTLRAIAESDRQDVEAVINRNQVAKEVGPEEFARRYNDGETLGVVLTSELGQRIPQPSGRALLTVLLPISLAAMLVGLFFRKTRLLALVGLSVVVAYAAAMGMVRADNYRFLITTSMFGITVAAAVARSFTQARFRPPGSSR